MAKRYTAQFRFDKEQLSDEEYEEILNQFEQLDQVEIETRKEDQNQARLSEAGTVLALNAAGLVVHGTDVLISLYQLARANHAFAGAEIQDENGDRIVAVPEEYFNKGAAERESSIGSVEGDINIEGDAYFIKEADIDFGSAANAGTDFEE